MAKKKLPPQAEVKPEVKVVKIKNWLHEDNPWLWSSAPLPEDIEEWNEKFDWSVMDTED